MNQFNFKSQPCTSREQSERLLALGLKPETADMCWTKMAAIRGTFYVPELAPINMVSWRHTPAWSLHRLWELLDKIKKYEGEDELSYPRISLVEEDVIVENPKSLWVRQSFISPKGVYENIINCLEELIKEGYFPKEYLE